jgi:hypothetical protein
MNVRRDTLLRPRTWMVVSLLGMLSSACSSDLRHEEENLGSETQAITCTIGNKCIDPMPNGTLGIWPGGRIRYSLVGDDGSLRDAMNDWEAATNNTIQFVNEPGTPSYPQVVIQKAEGGGVSPGFEACKSTNNGSCNATIGSDNAYHELGHIIGFFHEFQRFDRDRYVKLNSDRLNCADANNFARSTSRTGMLGPYDYKSTMHYAPANGDINRWDDTPVVPGTEACGTHDTLPLPVQCADKDCIGASCDSALGRCPTCKDCDKGMPMGFPTPGDASAVVEMYNSALDPRWSVFKRAINDDATFQPFDYSLDGVSRILAGKTLDAAGYPSGGIDMHVTGSNGHVWEKFKTSTSSFTPWVDLGALPGSGTVSDPSSVAWSDSRLDVTVRRGSTVYIKTWRGGIGWTTWQSLGTLSALGTSADSSPAITSWGANHLDVLVRGADNFLYWRKCTASCVGNTGTWSGWSKVLGGQFHGKPAVVSRGSGILDVFVHGGDDKLYGVEQLNNTWGSYYLVTPGVVFKPWSADCPDCTSPAAVARGSGMLDVIIRGNDDQAWIISWVSPATTWGPFLPIGGVLKSPDPDPSARSLGSSPTAASRATPTNRIDLFTIMGEERDAGDFRYGPWWKALTP